ncbi:MAG TPA: hypothetical protein PKD37_07820 [Oligoflexia bacterium]|nr:hypothetical protein [Oligoflexia bacterium]HMP27870.1 hypothetical protein [Oligoflexia bacterium]
MIKINQKTSLTLFAIILSVAAYFRLAIGLYWDDNQLLHPDERFLTMVANDIKMPESFSHYLDTANSPLNPHNHKNYPFFVYGTLPIFATKFISAIWGMNSYGKINIVGRVLVSLIDLLSIILLYAVAKRMFGEMAALLAASLHSLSVLNIQLSHFFGVELWTAFFILLAFHYVEHLWPLRQSNSPEQTLTLGVKSYSIRHAILAGLSYGLALASKISAVFFAPIFAVIFLSHLSITLEKQSSLKKYLTKTISALPYAILIILSSWISVRLFLPYAFETGSLYKPSPKLIDNFKQLAAMQRDLIFPPSVQWEKRSIFFLLQNFSLWSIGIGAAAAIFLGILTAFFPIRKIARNPLLPAICWFLLWFGYNCAQTVKIQRYLSIIMPFAFLIAGKFLADLLDKTRYNRKLATLAICLTLGSSLVWATAFSSIYKREHPRVAASNWIYQNIECGAKLANEAWDDALPLRINGRDGFGGCYQGLTFEHFGPDNSHKLEKQLNVLNQTDYIILSSNRVYGTIPRVPSKYPATTKYFELLFSGQLGFGKIAAFTSYPTILGFEINDTNSEESFTVYDHPKVLIFRKNSKQFDSAKITEILTAQLASLERK